MADTHLKRRMLAITLADDEVQASQAAAAHARGRLNQLQLKDDVIAAHVEEAWTRLDAALIELRKAAIALRKAHR